MAFDRVAVKTSTIGNLHVLKLGGSVITYKHIPFKANITAIKRIFRELSNIKLKVILVRGAGSFGHIAARRYALHKGYRNKRQLNGLARTKMGLQQLDRTLLESAIRNHIPIISINTWSCMISKDGRLEKVDLEPIQEALRVGLVPLLGGDVVPDRRTRFAVISGDQIAAYLAGKMGAKRLIFGTDVDGLYTRDPKQYEDALFLPEVKLAYLQSNIKFFSGATAPDVTRAMEGKVRECFPLKNKATEIIVTNLKVSGNLKKVLAGNPIKCTRILTS